MDHLGAGVGLLVIVGDRDRIKFADAVVAVEHAARIFPGDCRAGFDLRPRHLAALALAQCALGHEIIDAAEALGIAGIPVLDGRIFDLGIVQCDQLHHRGVKLVLVAHRRGATFEIADIGALVGDDQSPLELPGILGIDTEIGAEFHRTAHALGHVNEGAVRKDRAVERREIIVVHRHDAAEPFLHQLGIFADCLADRQENHPGALQLLAEGRRDAHAVEHRVDRDLARALDAREHFLLLDRDAELFINLENLGVDLVERRQLRLRLGRRVIISVLVIDRRDIELRPVGRLHRLPVPERLQSPVEHPLGLVLLRRDEADRVFGKPLGRELLFDVGGPAVLVIGDAECGVAGGLVFDGSFGAVGHISNSSPPRRRGPLSFYRALLA